MRDASNSIRPGRKIQGRVLVGVAGEAAREAPEHFFPSERIPRRAPRAGLTAPRCLQEPNSNAHHAREQFNPLCKLAGCPSSPAWQVPWVFQTDSSTSRQCYEHRLSGFTGNNLSLKTTRIAPSLAIALSLVRVRTINDWLQAKTMIPITAHDCSAHAHITPQPALRSLNLSQWDTNRDSGVPLPIFSEDLGTLVEMGTGQGECPVNCPMFAGRDIEPAVSTPAGGCAANHDPEVKVSSLTWLLHFGRVNQLSFECSGGMACLCGAAVVNEGPAVSPAYELTQTSGAGATALSQGTECGCAGRVFPLKEGRQKSKCLGLVLGGIEFEFIAESYGLHVDQLSRKERERQPRPRSADEDC